MLKMREMGAFYIHVSGFFEETSGSTELSVVGERGVGGSNGKVDAQVSAYPQSPFFLGAARARSRSRARPPEDAMYSKFDAIGDGENDGSSAATAPPAPTRDDFAKKLQSMQAQAQGGNLSVTEIMAQMKALPAEAKMKLMEQLGPLAASLQPKSSTVPDSPNNASAAEFASRLASEKSAFAMPKAIEREQEEREEQQSLQLVKSRIIVSGLVARPELNGRVGTITAWIGAKGRFAVKLEGVTEPVLLKRFNLVTTDELATKKIEGCVTRD